MRTVHEDDVALALGYLPVWIAEPAHYATWFDVPARGAHEVVLSRRVHGAAQVALVFQLDDHARLVAIGDGDGVALVEIAWTADGRGITAARIRRRDRRGSTARSASSRSPGAAWPAGSWCGWRGAIACSPAAAMTT